MNAQARYHLETMLPVASMDVIEPLACLAASAGLDLGDVVARLLSSGDARNGEVALQALLIANGSEMREGLVAALTHKRYRVRRKALRALVLDASEDERPSLARLAEDQSADVRLAFAQLMGEHRWPEAIDALIILLADPRDFAIHRSMSASWSKFRVARAAAHALGTYETLPVHAIDALIRAAKIPSTDPFVACAALSALANSDDERVLAVLIDALRSAGLNDSPSFRPRAQAASCAIFGRAMEEKVGSLGALASAVAERDLPTIAGPLLISAGILGGPERKALLERLRNARSDGREALVRAAAIAVDKVEGMTLNDREQILLHLRLGEELEALSIEDRSSIEGWSRGLDTQSGFDRFSAWIAEKEFHLPVSGKLDSIRTLDLPNTIPMLTMRSLSAYGEEDGGMDDGT
jgi:HEAT repeat protein